MFYTKVRIEKRLESDEKIQRLKKDNFSKRFFTREAGMIVWRIPWKSEKVQSQQNFLTLNN